MTRFRGREGGGAVSRSGEGEGGRGCCDQVPGGGREGGGAVTRSRGGGGRGVL